VTMDEEEFNEEGEKIYKKNLRVQTWSIIRKANKEEIFKKKYKREA